LILFFYSRLFIFVLKPQPENRKSRNQCSLYDEAVSQPIKFFLTEALPCHFATVFFQKYAFT
jgi:hypothetical protein